VLGPLVGAAVAAAVVSFAPPASAACRSTTCTGECARDANGCKTQGHPLYWSSLCVGFSLQRDGSVNIPWPTVERVVNDSFLAWTDLTCATGTATFMFARLADVACNAAEYNEDGPNANLVVFRDNCWTYTTEANTLGKTTVTYDNDTGEILDADIELNHAFNEFTTGDVDVVYDLQSILTHEIGHLVGLDHTTDFYATMNPGYQQGTTDLRSLEQDDTDCVCAIYPPERTGVCSTNPRGGLGDTCGAAAAEDEDDSDCGVRPLGRSPSHGRDAAVGLAGAATVVALRRRSARRRDARAPSTRPEQDGR
jgi:hypothetical protein